jgi:hypothetical protein
MVESKESCQRAAVVTRADSYMYRLLELCARRTKQGTSHIVVPEQGMYEVKDEFRQRDVETNEYILADTQSTSFSKALTRIIQRSASNVQQNRRQE